jgi:TRAP-type C4-dicarboxylate transport system substrate-binding protein
MDDETGREPMTMISRLPAFVLICFAALAHAQPVKLKFATFSPDTERLYNTVKKPWVAAVNKAAAGAIEIELYPNGALGRAPQQQAQMVLDGVTDIGFIVPPFTPGRFPDSEALELPGMFSDLAEGTRVYTRLLQNGTLKDYGDYYPVAMWSTPPFSLHSNFPINSIKDLKGKRVRGSGVIQIESLKALGAVTVGMPPTEVPEALSRRTIDASTSQPAVLYDFGLDRVTNHHYFIRLGIVPLAVVMNRKLFEGLPKAGQDAIRKHDMDYINKLYIESMLEYDSSLVQKLQGDAKRKVAFPDAADQKAAQAAFEPVIKAWTAKSARNAEVYKALTAELEKERSRK